MKKCAICWGGWDIEVNGHPYCAEHFVENNPENILQSVRQGIYAGKIEGKSSSATKRVLELIEKKLGVMK